MFDWLGFRTGYPLWRSYRRNSHLKQDVSEIFEGIAQTRQQILHTWVEEYWSYLDRLLVQIRPLMLSSEAIVRDEELFSYFQAAKCKGADYSELFVLNNHGEVLYSTYPAHKGMRYNDQSLLAAGLEVMRRGEKCLFGPFSDPLTAQIGPSTSKFHDAMTLLYMAPMMEDGQLQAVLCGRVPNDVLGDLIQRESGHVYPDSGDNYLFMAEPRLNRHIAPGTALSRSRFEDVTFTHGDNLKDGVRTEYGIVQVQCHTELELVFKDPATDELHPGVANTIKNGSNLFVEFPGYSDYRHIPVIGKGVTFQLPHCPDVWGMMCEGDLEEVYRVQGIGWQMRKIHRTVLLGAAVGSGLVYTFGSHALPGGLGGLLFGLLILLGGWALNVYMDRKAVDPVVSRLQQLNRFIRLNAEGQGDLTQRLPVQNFGNDETRELAKWINNMNDSLEGIMLKVKKAAAEVQDSQQLLIESTSSTEGSTKRMSSEIHDMIQGIRNQLKDIDVAKEASLQMSYSLRELEQKASEQIAVAQSEVQHIGEKMLQIESKVEESNQTIRTFTDTIASIGELLQGIERISAQTNLLSLNASIEAARAGEHGRGFAIVAGEIRGLAELTNQSTTHIQETLERITRQIEQTFVMMEEGRASVAEGTRMVASASELLCRAGGEDTLKKTQMVDEVVAAMERVASVSLENRKSSAEVERTVQELQLDMEQVRSTSDSVESITRSLLQLVNQFQLTETRTR